MDKSKRAQLINMKSEGRDLHGGNDIEHRNEIVKRMEMDDSVPVKINDELDATPTVTEEVNNHAKRRRDEHQNDEESDCSNLDVTEEDILLFIPSIQCNCSSWDMNNVCGDLLVTSIRVLFIASDSTNNNNDHDIAIDGRCIALHAIDTEALDGEMSHQLPHVYCQLSDPGCESKDVGCSMAFGMGESSNIMDENIINADDSEENEDTLEDNSVIEIYFNPIIGNHCEDEEEHVTICQRLFSALTRLASLNPMDESNDYGGGGGLFNMLSMMAGMENEVDDESGNDDMVIRLGGSNNKVVEDDESEGAPENERQALLNRLDNMLVVPPEYEILSEDEGQFDDAEDDIL